VSKTSVDVCGSLAVIDESSGIEMVSIDHRGVILRVRNKLAM